MAVKHERVLALKNVAKPLRDAGETAGVYIWMSEQCVFMPDPADPVKRPDAYKIVNATPDQYTNWCLRATQWQKKKAAKPSGQERLAPANNNLVQELARHHHTQNADWTREKNNLVQESATHKRKASEMEERYLQCEEKSTVLEIALNKSENNCQEINDLWDMSENEVTVAENKDHREGQGHGCSQ
jgi:hypothetical protein